LKPVLPILGCSLAVSALLFALMGIERAGVANPYSLRAFPYLALFQDFYAFAPYLVILLLALASPIRAIGIRMARWCGENPWPLAAATSLALAAVDGRIRGRLSERSVRGHAADRPGPA
jgi:hypothetical protein